GHQRQRARRASLSHRPFMSGLCPVRARRPQPSCVGMLRGGSGFVVTGLSYRESPGEESEMKPAAMSLVVVFAAAAAATVLAEKPAAPTPYHGKPHVIPGKIEAEHFDKGPAGVAYRDVDEKNLGADYREPTQV